MFSSRSRPTSTCSARHCRHTEVVGDPDPTPLHVMRECNLGGEGVVLTALVRDHLVQGLEVRALGDACWHAHAVQVLPYTYTEQRHLASGLVVLVVERHRCSCEGWLSTKRIVFTRELVEHKTD